MAAQEADAPPLQFIATVDPAALRRDFVAHFAIFGAHTPNRCRPDEAVLIRNAWPAHRLAADILNQRSVCFDQVNIGLLQNYFLSGTLTARLLARLARPADD